MKRRDNNQSLGALMSLSLTLLRCWSREGEERREEEEKPAKPRQSTTVVKTTIMG